MKPMLKKKGITHCLSLTIATLGLSAGDAYAQEIRTLKLLEPTKTVATTIKPKSVKAILVEKGPVFDQRDIRDVETFSLLVETFDSFNAATFVNVAPLRAVRRNGWLSTHLRLAHLRT